MTVGAKGEQIDIIAQRMVEERRIRMDGAKELLDELTAKSSR